MSKRTNIYYLTNREIAAMLTLLYVEICYFQKIKNAEEYVKKLGSIFRKLNRRKWVLKKPPAVIIATEKVA